MQSNKDLHGKVIVLTGANSGIGYEAALEFANRGATLALICRSEERGKQALSSIIKESGNDNVRLFLADFAKLSDIAKLAPELLQAYPKIDVLCNNAGGTVPTRTVTSEGFEWHLAVNHLSVFLLTQLLLPALQNAGMISKSRVVFTSSLGHTHSALELDNLNLANGYGQNKAYGRSKLMNLLTAREFHKRYGRDSIVPSSLHPGTVKTPLWGKAGPLGRVFQAILYLFMVDSKKGADTLVWLASSQDSECINANGKYFYKRKQKKPARFATDDAAEKLWKISMEMVKPFIPASNEEKSMEKRAHATRTA